MKTRKILFILSAIALALHAVWDIVSQIPFFSEWYRDCIWGHPLRIEIFWLPYTWLFLGGILLALIAVLVKTDEPKPTSKVHRYSTYAISSLYLIITISGAVNAVQPYLYVPFAFRVIFDVCGCAWLMMLVFHPSNLQLPKKFRSLIWIGIGLIAMLWLLQLISGISYLTTGHLMMFHSHALGNWLRYLVPTILLCCYSLYLLDKWPSPKQSAIRLTRNSHCTSFSFFERSYPIMRIIALVGIGVALFLFYMVRMGADSYFHIYYFEDFDRFVAIVLLSIIGILWLLLTFMAFFQLPNPRGYKIFNWLFLVLNLCLPIGLVISILFEGHAPADTIGELMGLTGLFALIFYLLWTFVRVVLYEMPKLQGIDKLKGIELKEGAIIPDGQSDDPENVEEYVSEERRICPCCGGRKDKFDLLCYYNNEGIIWSDFRHVLPQVAVPSLIQKCPHCGKYYITKGSHVLIKDTADFEFIDPVSWDYFKQSYEEYSHLDKDNVVDYNHRLRMMCAYNDEFNRPQNPPVPTVQDIMLFKDNMLHLMEYFSDPIDKAELYREMGLFDECFKQLEMVDDEGNESKRGYKEIIFDFAKKGSVRPFGWKEN